MSKRSKLDQRASQSNPKWLSRKRAQALLESAQASVVAGNLPAAQASYRNLLTNRLNARLRSLALNDLAVLSALAGDTTAAQEQFASALKVNDRCESARKNIAFIDEDWQRARAQAACQVDLSKAPDVERTDSDACKVAILSFLFNWPSTGGGIIHTIELAKFLGLAGYHVKHLFARKLNWGIGQVTADLPIDSDPLEFADHDWTVSNIQARYRAAVDGFDPDYVIITDCWNFKPLLAEAMSGYPYILRQQALELLCPLNNLRLLVDAQHNVSQCPFHQLATPAHCNQCLINRGHLAGPLHRAERELAGVGTTEYHQRLLRTLEDAEAVLVLNPLLESILSPFAKNVRVATWGMDAKRFPWPWPTEPPRLSAPDVTTLFMAGVIDEMIKGFHVLQEACARLWQRRKDFVLVATGEPAGQVNAFTRFTGWLSQDELPRYFRGADVVVVPTIAQEGLSRTSVEAMAVGRPVIGSRIGGMPYTITDGGTGLLCNPGDPDDLARAIERLLDDPSLRQQLGIEGRRRFEEEFTWERVIDRHYRPLLRTRRPRDKSGRR